MHPIILNADSMYRTDQLEEGVGIGEDMLAIGRLEGHLNPIQFAKAGLLYEGREVIEWIRKVGVRVKPRKVYVKKAG